MYRQSPGRSHRSKRLKMKHVLQISVLLGLCFWLLYQLKHSHHENNAEFEKDGGKDERLSRFGRKDVQDRPSGIVSKSEDEGVDEDNKLDETAFQRVEESDDEVNAEVAGGVTDEQEEDDQLNEPDENESEENASDEIHGRIKDPNVEDDENPSINEAREEHYKADDASSAVTSHESRTEEEEEEEEEVASNDVENEPLESEKKSEDGREDSDDDREEGEHRNMGTEGDLLDSTSPPNGTRSEGSIQMMVKNNNTDGGEVEFQNIQ